MKVNILGYAPDGDPTVLGILTSCNQLVPSLRGMKGAPGLASPGQSVLAATCQGAAVLEKLDRTNRFFAGTATKLYEASGTNWTDVSKSTAYGLATDGRWRYAQFGDVSLATNKADIIQASSATGAFADVNGGAGTMAPKAAIVETVNNFVFACDTNEATYGDSPNRWWCAAVGTYKDWAPSINTQCATGILTATAGKITAARKFGDQIVIYKDKSMYLGTYVGPPQIWSFEQIPGEVGALSHEAVANIGSPDQPKHIFMGYENFYLYDGARPVPIGDGLKEYVFNSELNRAYAYLSIALHDKSKQNVYFYYCSSSSTLPDKCVVYNYKTNKWGRDDRSIEAAVEYVSGGVTYDSLGTFYSTYDSLPSVSYDSSFWTAKTPVPAVFDPTHTVKTLNGAATSPTMTTGIMGDEQQMSCLTRVTPRFLTKPTAATMTNYYANDAGASLTTGTATAMDSNARFDVMREARWHALRFDFTGPVELEQFQLYMVAGGDE